jgi:hypothetical protein
MLYKGEIDSHITDKLLVRAFGSFVRDEIRINKVPTPGLPNGENDDIPDEIWGFNTEAVYTWLKGFDTLVGYDFKYRWARSGDNSFFAGPPPFTSITVSRALEIVALERLAVAASACCECSAQFRQENFCVFQIGGVEPFGEPVVHRGEEVASSFAVAARLEKARQTHCGPQLPCLCVHLVGEF